MLQELQLLPLIGLVSGACLTDLSMSYLVFVAKVQLINATSNQVSAPHSHLWSFMAPKATMAGAKMLMLNLQIGEFRNQGIVPHLLH